MRPKMLVLMGSLLMMGWLVNGCGQNPTAGTTPPTPAANDSSTPTNNETGTITNQTAPNPDTNQPPADPTTPETDTPGTPSPTAPSNPTPLNLNTSYFTSPLFSMAHPTDWNPTLKQLDEDQYDIVFQGEERMIASEESEKVLKLRESVFAPLPEVEQRVETLKSIAAKRSIGATSAADINQFIFDTGSGSKKALKYNESKNGQVRGVQFQATESYDNVEPLSTHIRFVGWDSGINAFVVLNYTIDGLSVEKIQEIERVLDFMVCSLNEGAGHGCKL